MFKLVITLFNELFYLSIWVSRRQPCSSLLVDAFAPSPDIVPSRFVSFKPPQRDINLSLRIYGGVLHWHKPTRNNKFNSVLI